VKKEKEFERHLLCAGGDEGGKNHPPRRGGRILSKEGNEKTALCGPGKRSIEKKHQLERRKKRGGLLLSTGRPRRKTRLRLKATSEGDSFGITQRKKNIPILLSIKGNELRKKGGQAKASAPGEERGKGFCRLRADHLAI